MLYFGNGIACSRNSAPLHLASKYSIRDTGPIDLNQNHVRNGDCSRIVSRECAVGGGEAAAWQPSAQREEVANPMRAMADHGIALAMVNAYEDKASPVSS